MKRKRGALEGRIYEKGDHPVKKIQAGLAIEQARWAEKYRGRGENVIDSIVDYHIEVGRYLFKIGWYEYPLGECAWEEISARLQVLH